MKFLTRRPFLVGLLQVFGLSAISVGVGMWLLPLGVIVAGVSLLWLAWGVSDDDAPARR
ncbi:MAG TPA: hypothetical protein VF174_08890 [Micromonosporaceae bacterium]